MLETLDSILVETLAEALETMAFIALSPTEDPNSCPAEAVKLSIAFTRPDPGSIELVAPLSLGRMLSSNVLGLEPDDPAATEGAGDALAELLNVTCGSILMKLASTSTEPFQMTIPKACPFDPADWAKFIEGQTAVLEADGHKIAIRGSGLD